VRHHDFQKITRTVFWPDNVNPAPKPVSSIAAPSIFVKKITALGWHFGKSLGV